MTRKDQLRNIYQRNQSDLKKTLTAADAKQRIAGRRDLLAKTQLLAASLGGLFIFLSVGLTAITLRTVFDERALRSAAQSEGSIYIPLRTSPAEDPWVASYQPIELADDSSASNAPLSVKWIKTAAYHIMEGQNALRGGDRDEALIHFNQSLAIYPDIVEFHYGVALLHVKNEEFEQAASHLEKALDQKETYLIVDQLGATYIHLQNYERAETNLQRALALNPEDPACHKKLGQLYRMMKQDQEAQFYFEKYLDLQPDDFDTLQTYAFYLIELGLKKEAATYLTQLTQDVIDVAPIYFILAKLQVENEAYTDAIETLQEGTDLIDPSMAQSWLSRKEFNIIRQTQEFQALVREVNESR